MKKYIVLLIISISFSSVFSQNLFWNGSAEQITSCPNTLTQIDTAIYWSNGSTGGSVDLYSKCSSVPQFTPPSLSFGYQQPRTGTTLIGFVLFQVNLIWPSTYHMAKEYPRIELQQPLVQNELYNVRCYISYSGFFFPNGNAGTCDSLGFLFTAQDTIFDVATINITPQLHDTSGFYTDTMNWIEIKGQYLAQGGEKYLIIGDFKRYDLVQNYLILSGVSNHTNSYHYLDDVAIWPVDTVPPVADAGLDTTICRGGKAKLGSHTYSDFIYQWSPTAGLSNDSGGVVWASPDTTTTYYLLATDDIFTKTKDSVTVFVNNCGQNDTTVCIENQFIIGTSPNPAWNYLWSPSTWLSSSTVATPICSPMASQSYQLLITNTTGDTIALDSTHVLVASCFFADAGLNTLICKDDSVQIGTHHFPYVQYHWTPNYMLSNPSVGNPVVWPDTSTYYYLQVTDSIGNVSNDSVLVNVQICTGINELQKPNYGMEVYPNPAIDYITVSLNNEYLEETDIAITVYDAQGKLVISRKLNSGTDQLIDIKQLNSGIYTAYLIIDGIISDSKKLIVINK